MTKIAVIRLKWLPATMLLSAVLVLAAGCQDTNPGGPEEVVNSAPVILEDSARARIFKLKLWYPESVSAQRPSPLVVFSHGLAGTPDEGQWLAQYLASFGYVVAAPEFPFTSRENFAELRHDDVLNQPGDVSYVIDQLLAGALPGLAKGVIDPKRIALVGHSFGGFTTFLLGYDRDLADSRVKAVVVLAGAGGDFLLPGFFRQGPAATAIPMLLLHGDNDLLVDMVSTSSGLFDTAAAPRVLVKYRGGSHLGFASGRSYGFNPDLLACWLAGDMLNPTADIHFHQRLMDRQPDTGIGPYTAPLPCQYQVPERLLMSTRRHHFLSQPLVLRFLESQWSPSPGALEQFLQDFSARHSDIEVLSAL